MTEFPSQAARTAVAAALAEDEWGQDITTAWSVPKAWRRRAAAGMFAPSIGVPEDIASANNTACLAAHMARFGTDRLTVDMGDLLGNPSTITATIDNTHLEHPVPVGGQAAIARTVVRQA
ncbi:PhzF family phenazine biosynthesis protein [Streptomyces sp. NPDC006476]|uniref:PhzF family phenazine biosynthesis protein n=1 Tax=Streptomyces sp. NPDC006476 TaxID=3157175 RepID=UPI00339F3060